MKNINIFGIINKINSVLFLILLCGGCLLIILGIVSSNRWQNRRTVEVVQNNDNEEVKIELILGNINNVPGFETQYVKLSSRASGGKFSSYSGGGEIRNVLFFNGKELKTHWLFPKHTFLINDFSVLKRDIDDGKKQAIAIYIETIKSDTNKDGGLDTDDLVNIALTDPYGKKFKEIETEVESVVDINVDENGNHLIMLFQKNGKVILKKYSLSTFELVSEKVIDEISKKL